MLVLLGVLTFLLTRSKPEPSWTQLLPRTDLRRRVEASPPAHQPAELVQLKSWATLEGQADAVFGLAFMPDGKTLLSTESNRTPDCGTSPRGDS